MTPEQQRWLDMRTAYRNHDYNNCHGFKNMAVTMAGELVIGLTKNTQFWHYSALYLERGGERLTGVREWDLDGKARGEKNMTVKFTTKQFNKIFKQKGTTKAPSDKPRYQPSEDAIQTAVINWAKLVKYKDKTLSDYLHHSPNGGKRDKAQAGIFKAMGTKAGYPDLTLNIARHGYHAMFIEMKRDKDQVPSRLQIQRMKMLEEEGNYCVVCKSFDHAVRELKWYMGIGLNSNRKLECGVC